MTTDRQSLQGLKKELTQAINKAATAARKEDRLEAADHAKEIKDQLFHMLAHHEKATKEQLAARKLLKRDD